jgi:hypothetical protein
LLISHSDEVEKVALALLEQEVIEGKELDRLLGIETEGQAGESPSSEESTEPTAESTQKTKKRKNNPGSDDLGTVPI